MKSVQLQSKSFAFVELKFQFLIFYSQEWTIDELNSFFSRFGGILSLSLSHAPYPFDLDGLVQFRRAEAALVLYQEDLFFKDHEVKVEAADSWHQPGWHEIVSLSFSFGNDVDPNPRMNDDCLREIFNHLDVWNLVSVADVCSRFGQIAQERFAKNHKKVNFDDFVDEKKYGLAVKFKSGASGWNGPRIRNFFEHFGSSIVELEISYFHPMNFHHITPNEILMLIAAHCSGTLQVLKIYELTLENPFLMTSHTLFTYLKKLFLHFCKFKDDVWRALTNCRELTKLKIENEEHCAHTTLSEFDITLPTLTIVSLKNVNQATSRQILQRNPQLKRITIDNCGSDPQMLKDVVQYAPNVEELFFKRPVNIRSSGGQAELMSFAQLTSLKKLEVEFIGMSVGLLLNNMVNANVLLEHLGVFVHKSGFEVISDEFIDGVCATKTLRSLRVTFSSAFDFNKSGFFQMIQMIESLPELTKLSVRNVRRIFDANDLVEIIRKAPKLEEIDWRRSEMQFNEETFKSLVQAVLIRGPPFPLKITATTSWHRKEIVDVYKNSIVVLTWHR